MELMTKNNNNISKQVVIWLINDMIDYSFPLWTGYMIFVVKKFSPGLLKLNVEKRISYDIVISDH